MFLQNLPMVGFSQGPKELGLLLFGEVGLLLPGPMFVEGASTSPRTEHPGAPGKTAGTGLGADCLPTGSFPATSQFVSGSSVALHNPLPTLTPTFHLSSCPRCSLCLDLSRYRCCGEGVWPGCRDSTLSPRHLFLGRWCQTHTPSSLVLGSGILCV